MPVAIILAGGFGKRLRPLTDERPKPLIEVAGKPIIVRQIEWLRSYGIKDFIVAVGYLKEKIIDALGSGSKLNVSISYAVEEEPLGTGGAIRNARLAFASKEPIIAVNGDIVTNIDPSLLFEPLNRGYLASMAVVSLRSPYGIIDLDGEKVVSFREKPLLEGYWINAGVYAMRPEIWDYLPEKGDLERMTFPRLAAEGRLAAVKYLLNKHYWRSIDTFKDIEEANGELAPEPKET